MPVDRDDAVVILLDYAMRDLAAACAKLADPRAGWMDFLLWIYAVIVTHPPGAVDMEQLALTAARRVTAEITLSL